MLIGVEAVALPHLVVVEIVRRGDLDAAGAELRIHVVVRDHRDRPAGERQLRRCLPTKRA